MARNVKNFPKSNLEIKRLKILTLHKSKMAGDMNYVKFNYTNATYYRTINKMKCYISETG